MYLHICTVHVMYTSEHGDGGSLASSIVAQEGSDLTLIHVQLQFVHSKLSLFVMFLVHEQSPQRTLFSNSISHTHDISTCIYM